MTNLGQELQDISFLLAQGKNSSENALNEEAALFALCAKTAFSPNDATAQRAFGGIVGRLNTLMVNESPQSRFELEDIGTGFPGRGLIEQQLVDHPGLTAPINQGLKIPLQMRPTNLAHWVKTVISCPAIRAQDAREPFTQQALDTFSAAGRYQQKHRHQRSRPHPQSGLFAQRMPAGFIHIDAWLLAGIRLGFFHRSCQCRIHPLFLGRNAAQADFGMQANFHQFGHIPVTHPKSPTQIANHRLLSGTLTIFSP